MKRDIKDKDYKPFACSYEFRGHCWAVIIYARTVEEAQQRCSVLGRLKLDGELEETIPVNER